MGVNPIDSQISVQRTTDLTKEGSNIHRRNDLVHDTLTVKGRAEDQRKSDSVAKLEDKNNPRINADEQNSGNAPDAEGRGKKRRKRDEDDDLSDGTQHIIDIRI